MSLAIHILAHKQPTQVERLIAAVLRPENLIVLHLDRRASSDLHSLGQKFAAAHSNVLLQRPREVIWFGWQGLHAQLEAMAIALKHFAGWTHLITLSGADFPLQPIEITAAQLAQKPATSFVSWFNPSQQKLWCDAKQRVERFHLASPRLQRVLQIPLLGRKLRSLFGWNNYPLPWVPGIRRRYPAGMPYLGGSNWCVLARPACEWLTRDRKAVSFANWIRNVGNPDEMYFQSTLCGGIYDGVVENGSGHFIEFSPDSASPRVFTREDFDRLLASGKPFARKFDENFDPVILDRLEEHLQSSSVNTASGASAESNSPFASSSTRRNDR
jgi:hypothetical protein